MKPFKDVYKIYDVSNARRIGAGGFGKVYLIKDKANNRKHAAKYQKLTSRNLRDLASYFIIAIFVETLKLYSSGSKRGKFFKGAF